MKVHMVQSSQGVRSTKRMDRKVHNNQMEKGNNNQTQKIVCQLKKTQEIHIWDHPISKLYTDDCGRFIMYSFPLLDQI